MATVEVDDELLKKARRIMGERTYSATIQKALEEMVGRERQKEALRRAWNLGDDIFAPGWLEEQGYKKPARSRVSADEKRASRKKPSSKVKARGAR
ncbi:MAG TPA: type II toxin-antitoxin system VapB family antitoxin [Thermoanaerobaculia bacterium]